MGEGRGEGVVTTARKSVTSVRREGGRARIWADCPDRGDARPGGLGSVQAEGAAEIGEVTVTGVHGLGEAVHAEV